MIAKDFRLMKPADLKGNLEDLRFPILATPKLDGIRFGTQEVEISKVSELGKLQLFSNSLKPIRNKECQRIAKDYLEVGLDGEIILRDRETNKPLDFQPTTSYVMSENKTLAADFPNAIVSFEIFDCFLNPSSTYLERIDYAKNALAYAQLSIIGHKSININVIQSTEILSIDEALDIHQVYLDFGYEGTIFRNPNGRYKFNRSTLKEQYSLKLKPFEDAEAVVVDVEPFYINLNESEPNERGYLEKSKTKENRKALDMLGALVVDSPKFGSFKIGTGFTHLQRREMWQLDLTGKIVKFKYMECGVKDKPRHPVFLGFRDIDDI